MGYFIMTILNSKDLSGIFGNVSLLITYPHSVAIVMVTVVCKFKTRTVSLSHV